MPLLKLFSYAASAFLPAWWSVMPRVSSRLPTRTPSFKRMPTPGRKCTSPTTAGWSLSRPSARPALLRPVGGANATQVPIPTLPGTPGANGQQPSNPFGGGLVGGAGQNVLLRLTLLFVGGLLVVAVLYAGYFFGFFDKWIAYFKRTFNKPAPVVLKHGFDSLGLNPPPWLNRWAFLSGLNPAERAFHSVYQSLYWLGMRTSPARTPAEAAAALVTSIPTASNEIRALLQQYELSLYSQEPADLSVARRAAGDRSPAFTAGCHSGAHS